MDDAEHEEDAVVREQVVHDPVVADAEAMEGVRLSADRLDLLAADAAGSGGLPGELLEVGVDPLPDPCRQLPVGALGGRREPDVVRATQAVSRSDFDRPRR